MKAHKSQKGTGIKNTYSSTVDTYDIFNILAGKVKVCKRPEVLREALFLFEVVSGFSDQVHVQLGHGGSSQTPLQRGSFSASAKRGARSSDTGCLTAREKKRTHLSRKKTSVNLSISGKLPRRL